MPTRRVAPARRICIVAHLAFATLNGRPGGGGVERQTSLLARWLARQGHHVTMITWAEGHGDKREIDGVRLVPVCLRNAGLPGLRFFHPRWSSLITALRLADAELYYHNGAEYVTGQVAWWCQRHHRKFVFSSASNSDCDATLPLLTTWRERVFYRSALTRADCIIVQTRLQQEMLRANFGRDSVVLPMPCEDPGRHPAGRDARHRLVWIGRVSEEKRPDRLLDVADRCPDLHFDLVGAPDDSAYAAAVMRRARGTSNVTVHGGVTRSAVSALLDDALALCCTSDVEGFPNTFLEAWSHGVPVVSTYDPDGLVTARGLGLIARPDTLAEAVSGLLAAVHEWRRMSLDARHYYLEHHTPEAAMPRFESLFSTVLESHA